MSQPVTPLIRLGWVTKAHGIKGEVSLEYQADSLRLLRPTVFLHMAPGQERLTAAARAAEGFKPDISRGRLTEYKVLAARRHQGHPLLLLEGITDRDAAELLRGHSILVPENRLPKPEEGEVYLYQLPGFTVLHTQEDGSETPLGTINNVDLGSGHEVWSIITPDKKEILFPAHPSFVLELNAETRIARITPPPGLLDIYLGE